MPPFPPRPLFQGPGSCSVCFLVWVRICTPSPLWDAPASALVDRADLPSPASGFLSVSRPGHPPSFLAPVALRFLPSPSSLAGPHPAPGGAFPSPTSGFCPGGCGFLSHYSPCTWPGAPPPRCCPPPDCLSAFTSDAGSGTGRRAQLLRSGRSLLNPKA